MITYGSVCSGIESASVAWTALGFEPAWLAEVEPFPCAVLAYRFPDVANLGDMNNVARLVLSGKVEAPDVLIGGTPCQAFSVAGMREGLADERGGLTIKYVGLADAIDHVRGRAGKPAAVVVWENVPGVLTDKANAFGCFLGALVGESCELFPTGGKWSNAGCVYGPTRAAAWRVLDAQYFGVAQRRRRVFVVASARNGFDPASILFEREGLRRDTAPGRREGQTVAGGFTSGVDFRNSTLTGDLSHTLQAGTKGSAPGHTPHVLFNVVSVHGTQDPDVLHECGHTLGRNAGQENAILSAGAIRRLTPLEYERLQGLPDNHTLVPWRGKPAEDCPDTPRYSAIGNCKAVPVVRWIGQRLAEHFNRFKE